MMTLAQVVVKENFAILVLLIATVSRNPLARK